MNRHARVLAEKTVPPGPMPAPARRLNTLGRLLGAAGIVGVLCALVAPAAAIAQGAQGSDRRPNIVVILGDDMGFSDMGCFGSEIKTPNRGHEPPEERVIGRDPGG